MKKVFKNCYILINRNKLHLIRALSCLAILVSSIACSVQLDDGFESSNISFPSEFSSSPTTSSVSQMDPDDIEILEGSWARMEVLRDGELIRIKQLDDEPMHFVTFDSDATFDALYAPGGKEIPYGEKGTWEPFDGGLESFEHTYLLSTQTAYTYEVENGYVKDIIEESAHGTVLVSYSEEFPNYLVWYEDENRQKMYVYKNADNVNVDDNEKESSPETPSRSTGTLGQQNALKKARSYLNSSAFSYDGLVDQLEYEGFSHSEAVYGADNCGADWNDQALQKALRYLKHSAFSESGLIEQLEYEGFTPSQAEYGVSHCGADWDEQAAKKAASYLRHSSFSRSDLIDQLEYEGFSYSQAVYGVTQNRY